MRRKSEKRTRVALGVWFDDNTGREVHCCWRVRRARRKKGKNEKDMTRPGDEVGGS